MSSSTTSSEFADGPAPTARHRRYLAAFAAVWAVAALPLAGNALFLMRQGEFLPLPEIVRQQRQSPVASPLRYGTALHADTAAFKAELWRQAPAGVAALGSSRVMQFREAQFRVPFVNLGGTIGPVHVGRTRFDAWFAENRPQIVLLGIDSWWLVWEESRFAALEHGDSTRRFRPDLLAKPSEWLWSGRLALRDYLATILGQTPPFPGIGVKARMRGTGFGRDGSYYYYSANDKPSPSVSPKQLQATIQDIRLGHGRFIHAAKPHPEDLEDLLCLIADLQAKGIDVIAFLPPFPSVVHAEIIAKSDSFSYIDVFLTEARRNNLTIHDLHDPAIIGATDADFVDEYHGSDALAAKVLTELAKREPLLSDTLSK